MQTVKQTQTDSGWSPVIRYPFAQADCLQDCPESFIEVNMKKKRLSSNTLGEVVGVAAFLRNDDGRPDLFEEDDEGYFHFPCGDCTHRKEIAAHCRKCRHYID